MAVFRYKFTLFFVGLFFQPAFAEQITKGLYFQSYDVSKENRTSLHLPVPESVSLHDGFTLDFEMNIRNEIQNFGYVFRLVGKNSTALDLVISDLRVREKVNLLSLLTGNKVILAFKKNEVADFKFDTWNKVTVSFSKNIISMIVNGIKVEYAGDYDNIRKFDLYFGANAHPAFFTTETPPMILRNIRLFNKDHKTIRYWPLDKHSENVVYDEYKKEAAFALNPKWELDKHLKWERCRGFRFAPHPQVAFDDEQERIFIIGCNEMLIYHIQSDRLDTVKNIRGAVFGNRANHLFYDSNTHQPVSYILSDSLSGNRSTEFDFRSNQWNNEDNTERKPFYWHHGRVFVPEDSLFVTIGGYGFHRYNGVLIKYDCREKKWTKTNISHVVSPRYLGSAGYRGNGKLLYFGGYGSESGNQEEHPVNYYDLYEIDLRTDSITQLWAMELPVDGEHFTNSNSMTIDKEEQSFYVLTYSNKLDNTNIQVKKFSLLHPGYTHVGDTIPYIFRDNKSYCDLFLGKRSNRLVAITAHTGEDNTSDVNIYSILYPPLSKTDVFQTGKKSFIPVYWYFLLLLPFPFFFFLRKKKEREKLSQPFVFSQDMVPLENIRQTVPIKEVQASSVNLLGGFYVIDDSGTDITGNFKPITIQLFLLCLLFSIKNDKGITSQELKDILWYDKDDDNARNNRNVNISKLRVTLKNVRGFEINKENGYWTIAFGKDVSCDYKDVLSLIKKIESEETIRKDRLNELLDLALKGVLLPSVEMEWLDSYKLEYSSLIIEKLLQFLGKENIREDFGLVVKMANVILLHDNIDEDAIVKKCHALYYSGKKGQAKQSFKKFTKDYKNMLGTEYKYTFEQFRDIFIIKA